MGTFFRLLENTVVDDRRARKALSFLFLHDVIAAADNPTGDNLHVCSSAIVSLLYAPQRL